MTIPTARGPITPDDFRRKVGRYGDRFYCDPLPACEIADVTDETWPSVSLIKKAWPTSFEQFAAKTTAEYAFDHYDTLHDLDRDGAIAAMVNARKANMNRAAERGTAIHELLETLADGRQPDPILNADALPYVPAAMALLEELQPVWLLSEAVAISRTYKVGGTLDAAWYIPRLGVTALVDFKTRAKHQAYDVEAAQCGGYFVADYVIVDDGTGQPVRRRLPEFDTAIIITITPDGYRLHPITVDGAKQTFISLRDFWDKQKVGRQAIGSPLILPPLEDERSGIEILVDTGVLTVDEVREKEGFPPVDDTPTITVTTNAAAEPEPVANVLAAVAESFGTVEIVENDAQVQAWLLERATLLSTFDGGLACLAKLWPAGVPTLRECRELDGYLYTADQAQAVHEALSAAEGTVQAPFPTQDPREPVFVPPVAPPPPEPLQLVPGDARVVARLGEHWGRLPSDLKDDIIAVQRKENIPSMVSGKATRGQVARVAILIRQALRVAEDRAEMMKANVGQLSELGCEPDVIRSYLDTVGQETGVPCTAAQVDAFDALVGWVVLRWAGLLAITPDGVKALTQIGKRPVVAQAKQLAPALGLDPPTKFDQLVALPALAAWAHTILINTADQEAKAA